MICEATTRCGTRSGSDLVILVVPNAENQVALPPRSLSPPHYRRHRKMIGRCVPLTRGTINHGFDDFPLRRNADPINAWPARRIGFETGKRAFVRGARRMCNPKGIAQRRWLSIVRIEQCSIRIAAIARVEISRHDYATSFACLGHTTA